MSSLVVTLPVNNTCNNSFKARLSILMSGTALEVPLNNGENLT
jgi:hypothetical protein